MRPRSIVKRISLFTAALFFVVPLVGEESHLGDLRQLTTGGENAEAYWSPDGERLVFQRTGPEGGCDQIFVVPADGSSGATQISPGEGRTTCAYFLSEGDGILYSTTGLADAACPAPPDHSRGYVWALYDTYEIVVRGSGGELVRLTENEAYDAEATVCPVDGSIVFTSDRDGDLEIYRMDADGANVTRLTEAPGYDGGAFFSPDCSRIVWRASRPRGEEIEEYKALLAEGLIRPGRLEIWTADADGGNARQVTYLGAASFAPSFFPDGQRILFSSNWHHEGGREFDLWAVDVQGTRLERVTEKAGFDGFPMFSPDGTRLAFATNRFVEGANETNVAVAQWIDHEPRFEERAADRFLADVRWLSDAAREGRGAGTKGLADAADWLEAKFREIGLAPGYGDSYRQAIEIPVQVRTEEGTRLAIDGTELLLGEAWSVTGFSASGDASAEVVPAGYGIVAPELDRDDYAGLDVSGKVVVVRRFVPGGEDFEEPDAARRYGDLRYKAFTARERGAVGLLVVDLPEGEEVDESPLPGLGVEQRGDAGIPVAVVRREGGAPLFEGGHRADLSVRLVIEKAPAVNLVGRLPVETVGSRRGAVVLGAHYDHLGHGGSGSLAPESDDVHNGADDNASGTAALLEAARSLVDGGPLDRDVWFVAFAGEENGLVGSTRFTREPPADLALDETVAMVNFDMVGRLRDNRVQVLGGDSAAEWPELLEPLCAAAGLECATGGDGYGPSDQTPFYAAGVPVLHFFTGAHDEYHKPSDDWPLVNAAGGARIAALAASIVSAVAGASEPLTYREVAPPAPAGGDVRSYGASLGTIPDYVGPEDPEKRGVLLAGVRPGSPAEKAGMQRGDLLVELAGKEIGDIYDFMFVLRSARPGQEATAVVERGGERVPLVVIFGENTRIR